MPDRIPLFVTVTMVAAILGGILLLEAARASHMGAPLGAEGPEKWLQRNYNAERHGAIDGGIGSSPQVDWQNDVDYKHLESVIKDGFVITGSQKSGGADLIAWNETSGEEQWRISDDKGIAGDPAIWNHLVIVGTDSAKVLGVDFRNGTTEWTFSVPDGGRVRTPITVHDDLAFAASGNGNLYAIEASTGELSWSKQGKGGRAAGHSGQLFTNTGDEVVAFDAFSGSQLWMFQHSDDAVGFPVYHDGSVYFGDMGGTVYSLDSSTGDLLWSVDTGKSRSEVGAVGDEALYDTGDNTLSKVSFENQTVEWSVDVSEQVISSMLVGDTVVIGTRIDSEHGTVDSNLVQAREVTDGGLVWERETKYKVTDVSFANGRVHVSTGESGQGRHIALSFSEGPPDPPRNLSIVVDKSSTSRVEWSPPHANGSSSLSHYNIYRNTSTESISKIAQTPDTSYTDTGLECGTTYYYRVTAVNEDGMESAPSNTASSPVSAGALSIPWSEDSGSAPETPALGYRSPAGSSEMGYCHTANEMVELTIDTGAFGQYHGLDDRSRVEKAQGVAPPEVSLHLDLEAILRVQEDTQFEDDPKTVATLQAEDSGDWIDVHTFEATPEDPDMATTDWNFTDQAATVPVDLLSEGVNGFRLVFEAFQADGAEDTGDDVAGWGGTVDAARLQLVASPTFILHGWDFDANGALNWDENEEDNACDTDEDPALREWQCPLRDALIDNSKEAFGQNPWAWDGADGRDAVALFDYNGKQAINQTVAQLDSEIEETLGDEGLNWNGHPSLVGHSMGGLVARTYSVSECPSHPQMAQCPLVGANPTFRANRIVTMGTPHLGSHLADIYTCQPQENLFLENNRDDYWWGPSGASSKLLEDTDPEAGQSDCIWHDYYSPDRWNVHNHCGGAPGMDCTHRTLQSAGAYKHVADDDTESKSYLADFQLRTQGPEPATANTFLRWLNKEYASLDQSNRFANYAIAGDCRDTDCRGSIIPGPFANTTLQNEPHDSIVPVPSAVKTPDDSLRDLPHLQRNADDEVMASEVCQGPEYHHNNLHSSSAIQNLTLGGLADAVLETKFIREQAEEDCTVPAG